jgi:predicted alpha/beta-hydrolase family hydrolase
VDIITEAGAARAELDGDGAARFLLVLTHGAGGSVEAPDVLAVRDAGLRLGAKVARVTQPYLVRGARAPGSAVRQDAAWIEIVAALRELAPDVPLVQGGRSNGARVVCRTAAAVGARAVIALAFPLHPPQRLPGRTPPSGRTAAGLAAARAGASGPGAGLTGAQGGTSEPGAAAEIRLAELRAARAGGAMVLVVNGERDPFGIPHPDDADRVVIVPRETHSLKGHRAEIATAVAEWLPGVLKRG